MKKNYLKKISPPKHPRTCEVFSTYTSVCILTSEIFIVCRCLKKNVFSIFQHIFAFILNVNVKQTDDVLSGEK